MTPPRLADHLATARIVELLERLDPTPRPVCTVPGCRHDHDEELPAAA
jgi:hypothetical protein